MHCKVTLSANAGIAIQFGGKKILVDAFSERADDGISVVTPEMFAQLIESSDFSDPDYLFFTHGHADHYSEVMTKKFLAHDPSCTVIGLSTIKNARGTHLYIELNHDFVYQSGNLRFNFIALAHEGGKDKATPHFGCVLTASDENLEEQASILIAGDAKIGSSKVEAVAQQGQIDLAILDFPWLTAQKGKAVLFETLRQSKIILYHLPRKCEDQYGYLSAVDYALTRVPEDMEIGVLNEFLASKTMTLGDNHA